MSGSWTLLGDTWSARALRESYGMGECDWTLLADNTWDANPHRITRLVRMPYLAWMRT